MHTHKHPCTHQTKGGRGEKERARGRLRLLRGIGRVKAFHL